MKKYSIFHAPFFSFFSKNLYKDVCNRWRGIGFLYLLLLLAVCWAILAIKTNGQFSKFVNNEAPKIISQIPTIYIEDGKASIKELQPYYIVNPDTKAAFVVIDTQGNITSLDEAKSWGLITETAAFFKKSSIETRSFSFSDIDQFTLTQAKINGWVNTTKKFLIPVSYPFAVLGSFFVRIIQVLIYAALGLLLALFCKSKRTYAELLRLSAIAITPCIIIKTIMWMTGVNIPLSGLLFFLITMGFLFFGVKVNSNE